MIFVNHQPKKLAFTWAFNHTSEDGLLSFHKKYGIMELWSCRVTCPFSKMVDALPSGCSDWFWSGLVCPGSLPFHRCTVGFPTTVACDVIHPSSCLLHYILYIHYNIFYRNLDFCDKDFLTLCEDWQEILMWRGYLPAWIPNYFKFAADTTTRWTTGRRSLESLESLFSVPTTNNTQPTVQPTVFPCIFLACFIALFCVLVVYLVEKQNGSAKSAGPGIIAGLRAGRSVLQWQPWNHNWRQQTSVTVCVLV